jgi:hypothetical protein
MSAYILCAYVQENPLELAALVHQPSAEQPAAACDVEDGEAPDFDDS